MGCCSVACRRAENARVRCQQVENLIVGAPCGVMDQMASICGEAGSLMSLLCQPAEFQACACPTDWVWGSIRHPAR
jgi:galactokinase